ncbi:MAG: hypothetical protein ACR2FO_05680 [Actinomycetota bacterium]
MREEFARPEEVLELLQETVRQVQASSQEQSLPVQENTEDAPETFLKEAVKEAIKQPVKEPVKEPVKDGVPEDASKQLREPAQQEEEDFWGEARPWGSKRNRAKSKGSGKPLSPRPAIVRVDAEGAAVKGKGRSKEKGK